MKIQPYNTGLPIYQHVTFRSNKELKPDNADKNLIEYEKNNFISGIYYTDMLNKENNDYCCKKIDYYMNDPSLNTYNSKIPEKKYDELPYKFAAIVKKLENQHADTIIKNKIPELFKNTNIKNLTDSLDTLAYIIRDNPKHFRNDDITLVLGNDKVNLEYIGSGCNSSVFKLSKENTAPVAMKIYKKPEDITSFSIFGELGLYQQLKNEKISNIPDLYLANPVSVKVVDNTKNYDTICDVDNLKYFDGYKGAWAIVEYITPDTPVKPGISLHEWLKKNSLYHIDTSCDNCIGAYIVDLGGITS